MGNNRPPEFQRLLIVDDEPLILEVLEELFSGFEYPTEMIFACDGVDALKKINGLEVDCVLSDIRMPNMDGIELLRKLRENGYDRPFLILSGFLDRDITDKALDLGAFDVISKPIREKELFEKVQVALEIGRSLRLFDAMAS